LPEIGPRNAAATVTSARFGSLSRPDLPSIVARVARRFGRDGDAPHPSRTAIGLAVSQTHQTSGRRSFRPAAFSSSRARSVEAWLDDPFTQQFRRLERGNGCAVVKALHLHGESRGVQQLSLRFRRHTLGDNIDA
jgi:hypothetical protein